MKQSKFKKELNLTVGFCSIYLLLKIFQYHLDKFFTGVPIDIIIKVLYVVLLVMFVTAIFTIFRRRSRSKGRIKLRFALYLPFIILLITVLYRFSPVKLDSEKLESKVVLHGCYEATGSQATIRLRTNKNFEIKWMSDAGADEWYSGTYSQNKDTFFLIYEDKIPDKFGSIILKSGQNLICLDNPQHKKEYYVLFTIGSCKGLTAN